MSMVDVKLLTAEMREFVEANTYDGTATEEERERKVFQYGYAALLEAAQAGKTVPMPLYSKGAEDISGTMMVISLSDYDMIDEMELTTDVNAFTGGPVVTVEAEQLPKDWVLNPEDLPCDEDGTVRWDKILDDVYRNNKHYQILADWRKVRLSQDIHVRWGIRSLRDAQDVDAKWRAEQKEKALYAYVDGLIAKSGLELDPKTNIPKNITTPDQLYAAQFKALLDMVGKNAFL